MQHFLHCFHLQFRKQPFSVQAHFPTQPWIQSFSFTTNVACTSHQCGCQIKTFQFNVIVQKCRTFRILTRNTFSNFGRRPPSSNIFLYSTGSFLIKGCNPLSSSPSKLLPKKPLITTAVVDTASFNALSNSGQMLVWTTSVDSPSTSSTDITCNSNISFWGDSPRSSISTFEATSHWGEDRLIPLFSDKLRSIFLDALPEKRKLKMFFDKRTANSFIFEMGVPNWKHVVVQFQSNFVF